MPGCGGAAARWTAGRCTAAARARGCSAGRRQPGVRRGLGLAGFCPRPALVNAAGLPQALIFVAAMVAGMALFSALEYLKHRQ